MKEERKGKIIAGTGKGIVNDGIIGFRVEKFKAINRSIKMGVDEIILALQALLAFMVLSLGWVLGYWWRMRGERKTITEYVKAIRDYKALEVENKNLREVIKMKEAELEKAERDRKILEACNVDMVSHECKCGKKNAEADEAVQLCSLLNLPVL